MLTAIDTTYTVRNRSLRSLDPEEFEALRPELFSVNLRKRAILYDAGKQLDAVYFIECGIVTRSAGTRFDAPVEVAMVGTDGFVGLAVLLATSRSIHRTSVALPGSALRISSQALRHAIERRPSIREKLLRYVNPLMAQKSLLSVCNARHSIENRVSRWLMTASELAGSALAVTHQEFGELLGVRRSSVSTTLDRLEHLGCIRRTRGTITIVSRDLLQHQSCNCAQQLLSRCFSSDVEQANRHVFRAA